MKLSINQIVIDCGTQHRQVDLAVSQHYQERIEAGDKFPPLEVYQVNNDYVLTDGFHRLSACVRLGYTEIDADVTVGSLREAVLASYGANKAHGLPRSDVKTTIRDFYRDERTNAWGMTQQEIADLLGCSKSYVNQIANELSGGKKEIEDDFEIGPEVKTLTPPIEREAIQDADIPQCPPVDITDSKALQYAEQSNRIISLCQNIQGDLDRLEALSGVGYEYIAGHRDDELVTIRTCIKNLMSFAPIAECPMCNKDKDCCLCKGVGYITGLQKKNLPSGLLEAL